MKVYIIAAVSADGFIAKSANELIDWTSLEDKKLFREMTKKSGVVIMGGNTYRTFKSPLANRRNIVITRQAINEKGVETTQETPEVLIARLEKDGYPEVAVAGGREIYTMFLQAGIVTDIYLTVEPIMFGAGFSLASAPLDIKLALAEVRKINENSVLLHYKVKK